MDIKEFAYPNFYPQCQTRRILQAKSYEEPKVARIATHGQPVFSPLTERHFLF